ncbi:MAG: cytochrome C oxidase subunit IV family protein [Planctomycetes bacterium]|nr:cytochrome C oxidase subunit IV family protein [Planctomycetota bacterium]
MAMPASETATPRRTYFAAFLVLLALTLTTYRIAGIDLGALNAPIALAIAGTKASLVMLVFMHVKFSSRLIRLFAAAGFAWLTILIVLTLTDYLSRSWIPILR